MVTDHSGIGLQSDNETEMYVRIAAIRAGIMGGDLRKAHPLTIPPRTYARIGYSTIKASADKVGLKLA